MVMMVLMGAMLLVVIAWRYCKTSTALIITVDEHDKGELVTPNASITTTATNCPITDDKDDVGKLV